VTLVRRSAVAATALLCCAATAADAPGSARVLTATNVAESIEYYDIGGSSVPTLWQNISARGPTTGVTPWAGHARWLVSWTFGWREDETGCRIERAATHLEIRYTLPRWADRDKAESTLRAKWDRFSEALLLHEQGHGAHGRRAAVRIEMALLEVPIQTTCQELARTADETARAIIAEEAAHDRAYDLLTQHGISQGAVLR